MKYFKKNLPVLASLIAISSWNINAFSREIIPENISPIAEITIENLSGNFGEILIENGFTRTFHLRSKNSIPITISSFKITNDIQNSFSLKSDENEANCRHIINPQDYCSIPIFFKPKSIHNETAQLIVNYSIDSREETYIFNLNGWGKESSEGRISLSKLGKDFINMELNANAQLDENFPNDIIPSAFAKNHSGNFNYPNHSFGNPQVFEGNINTDYDYSRTSGYTFRVDDRAPHVPYKNKLCRKFNKRKDKMNCGIQDLGGFWPYGTMNVKPNVAKIELLLNKYISLTGNDYDLEKVSLELNSYSNILPYIPPLSDLSNDEIEKMDVTEIKYSLYKYLNNQLNLEQHVRKDYTYTGFISTTASPRFLLNYHESATRNWFYVMYVEGGVRYYDFGESEFAVPGGIDWADVMGYYDRKKGKAYIRQGFESLDKEAYDKINNVFSILNNEFNKEDYVNSPISLYIQPF
ncbi:hypothetical protein [Fluviispira sanaruensis]|uniref:Uncharacterized protein n=1 Tax=Fluviispira sanaruensis TaxID=2493639 RepID=A0A4P2VXM1_FLUSA|nr:hypothetical protein [Fluviispira sanaruensis]BBH53752.1 hypothetical protein JCM31447_22000 [Fluviispira sanaruensis]